MIKMEFCVYYEKRSMAIIDFLPKSISLDIKTNIMNAWNTDISREILLTLSEKGEMTAPEIKKEIGHSMSTLHENIKKLENMGLISTQMTYTDNKKKVIKPKILTVTKNLKYKTALKKFFQGLWINSKKTQSIIDFLEKNKLKYFTPDEISIKTKIPVDDVELLLSNWESFTTKGIKNMAKEAPFEKKVLYKYKK